MNVQAYLNYLPGQLRWQGWRDQNRGPRDLRPRDPRPRVPQLRNLRLQSAPTRTVERVHPCITCIAVSVGLVGVISIVGLLYLLATQLPIITAEDNCRPNPCLHGGSCYNLIDGVFCSCPFGWQGKHCSEVTTCLSTPCRNNATCISDESGHLHCHCPQHYHGQMCDKRKWYCREDSCHGNGRCRELSDERIASEGPFVCLCDPGYIGMFCEFEFNECRSSPCFNNATCTDLVNNYTCSCDQHFHGHTCAYRNWYCRNTTCSGQGLCHEVATPKLIDHLYVCQCDRGWTGKHCDIDYNECLSNPCENGGVCINELYGNYSCNCSQHYLGSRCQERKWYCNDKTVQCNYGNGTCREMEDCDLDLQLFACDCNVGWTGTWCDVDINECRSYPCENGGTCTNNLHGDYTCDCPEHFRGYRCQQRIFYCINETCNNQGHCREMNDCQVRTHNYICDCFDGYTGTNCETDVDECASNPCHNNGTCTDLIAGFSCACLNATGTTCDQRDWFCGSVNCGGTCLGMNTVDVQAGTTHYCMCPPGFTGWNCMTDMNVCAGQCGYDGVCAEGVGDNFACSCKYPRVTGALCQNTAFYCTPDVCNNYGTCHENWPHNLFCMCVAGRTGDRCEININECATTPYFCLHVATCIDTDTSAKCICAPEYTGRYCETPLPAATCRNGGTLTIVPDGEGTTEICICPVNYQGKYCEEFEGLTSCGLGWIGHKALKRCYKFFTISQSHADAAALCDSMSVRLISMDSLAEQTYIDRLFQTLALGNRCLTYWSSGTRPVGAALDELYWDVTDKDGTDFRKQAWRNWEINQPNNPAQRCITLIPGRNWWWNDAGCAGTKCALCEQVK